VGAPPCVPQLHAAPFWRRPSQPSSHPGAFPPAPPPPFTGTLLNAVMVAQIVAFRGKAPKRRE
jgi:hypothetical protein